LTLLFEGDSTSKLLTCVWEAEDRKGYSSIVPFESVPSTTQRQPSGLSLFEAPPPSNSAILQKEKCMIISVDREESLPKIPPIPLIMSAASSLYRRCA
jgi:hypothetical protein